jgi:lipoyl(octanoyl) transferase
VVQTDRGGQVTFHGPGQIVGYLMFDLRRMDIGVRDLVSGIEEAVVAVLADYSIEGAPRPAAPGVYVNGAKVAALGLRVRRGCSYHGLALNVNMDLEPFSRINPCGLLGMEVTQIRDLGGPTQIGVVQNLLLDKLSDVYGISLSRLDR